MEKALKISRLIYYCTCAVGLSLASVFYLTIFANIKKKGST